MKWPVCQPLCPRGNTYLEDGHYCSILLARLPCIWPGELWLWISSALLSTVGRLHSDMPRSQQTLLQFNLNEKSTKSPSCLLPFQYHRPFLVKAGFFLPGAAPMGPSYMLGILITEQYWTLRYKEAVAPVLRLWKYNRQIGFIRRCRIIRYLIIHIKNSSWWTRPRTMFNARLYLIYIYLPVSMETMQVCTNSPLITPCVSESYNQCT